MKFSTVKKYRKKHKALASLLLKNPVLVMGLDIPFVIATSYSLRSAVAISIQMLFIHMFTVAVGTITCRKLPPWQRAMANVAVSTLIMMASRAFIVFLFQGVSNALGMYLYLMAVNGMTLLQANTINKRDRFLPVMYSALLNVLGFSLVVIAVSLVRELLGNGTLWGVPILQGVKLAGLLLPFGGFMIVAFMLAGAKFINKKLLYIVLQESARKEAHYTKIKVISEELF